MMSYDYLYSDGTNYIFMSQETYDQVELSKETLGGAEMFLNDGDKVKLQEFNGIPINVELDPSCALEVIETPPGEK
jgi:elongation factor P